MDNSDKFQHKRKTVPIRRRHGESSSSNSTSDVEGTFIPIALCESSWTSTDFVNPKFREDEDEDVVQIVDLQNEEKPPLFLLFPDLEDKDKKRLASSTSTTQVTKILMGKKADFSLLRPSKKLNPEQSRLPPLVETIAEYYAEDEELGN